MKPSLPKGTRDFNPIQSSRRDYIFSVIKDVFLRYGYRPIETPAMEALSTLTGKYGEEGDRLLFKILNNGDFLAKANEEALAAKNSNALVPSISKRGLRYDLTVPFARFVVMNQNDIAFPFKRYQIQPVWRADRPQRGRYQEFFQCDVDVVGSNSLVYEAELTNIFDEVFDKLNIPVVIRINNRKILQGIAEHAGVEDLFIPMTVAIDKMDKIGEEGVRSEMERAGFSQKSMDTIFTDLKATDIDALSENLSSSSIGMEGIEELRQVRAFLDAGSEMKNEVLFDWTLARGLSYYTGCIFEVLCKDVQIGSIGGGGRYDDLTSVFGLKNVSGVGVSFGAERIYDVMEELELFPSATEQNLKALILTFDKESLLHGFGLLSRLRSRNVAVDLYPDATKMQKQMKYANARSVPFVILIGSDEIVSRTYSVKNMLTGEQIRKSEDELVNLLM